MREIIRADNSGFCFGVKRALEKAEDACSKYKDEKIYTCGQLIHNRQVTDELKKKGVGIINDIREAETGSIVIIRSHGEGEKFYEDAEQRGIKLVDATCPFVKKIHDIVKKAGEEGYDVIIAGDKEHPEVKGIDGWCSGRGTIIADPGEGSRINSDKVFIVSQTTLAKKVFSEIVESISAKEIKVADTICDATVKRQKSTEELADKVEGMVIIGGKNSSNTKKLYELSKKYCSNSFFVENIEDLPLKDIKECNKIGVAAGASTPECVIKEVIAKMSENITNQNEELSMDDLMEDIEKSLRLPRGGEIVTGTVHQVSDKEIIVNLGCKKDGIIPLDEITLEGEQKLTDLYKEGDEIQAKVVKTDDGDGSILLSKKKLEVSEHWNEINDALENKTILEVKVVRVVNGGVIAAYKEVSGFIPLSQLSDRFVEDPSEFVGKVLPVRVSRVDQRRGKAVFSHKMYLNTEKEKKVAEIWEKINVDDVVKGTVMRFTDYGAFVDIGGIDGLLHISEISWGKLKHPKEVLSIGEEINVKILSMNSEKGKISLGLKQNQPEPWSVINDKYKVGQVVNGKVVQIKEYGAFVELEPGLDGLVHISEVAHKRVTNIADELEVGQQVTAKILEIDQERKRISLSIKETLDEDGEEIENVQESEEEVASPEDQESATEEPSVEETTAEETSENEEPDSEAEENVEA